MPTVLVQSQAGHGITTMANPTAGMGMAQFQQTSQTAQPLRRAVYIHVSDVTNAYNIDHAKLEAELNRVKGETPDLSASVERLTVPSELDTNYSQKRLQPPRGGYNLCVLVGKVQVVVDKRRVDGSQVRLAEVEVGDETGTVSLRARDEQIDTLQDVSERTGAVVLRNCTLELFQGKHIRLAITKWGKLSTYPDQVASTPPPPSKINRDRNFSLIDLSLVASEMAVYAQAENPYQPTDVVERTQATQAPTGRSQPFQIDPSRAGGGVVAGGRGRRPPSRGKPIPSSMPAPLQYTDAGMSTAASMRYQSALHGGYGTGFAEPGMEIHQYAYPQQRETLASTQQQIMLQRQYEMQHRQLQHMYHSTQEAQRPPQMALHPMTSTSSFAKGMVGNPEGPVERIGSNPFLVPSQAITSARQSAQPTHMHASRAESPNSSGKMNPQAATFDPSSNYPKPPHP